jgi:vancomycin resistance protein YoaR
MTTETHSVAAVPSAGRDFAWRRSAIAFGITLVALIAFAIAFAAAYASLHEGRILPGVSVGNAAVAGLERGAAQAALESRLPDVSSGGLTVKVGDNSTQVVYAEIDRHYDMPQMLAEAFGVGRDGTPLDQVGEQLHTMLNGVDVPVAITWDQAKLAGRIQAIANAAAVAPVDATIVRPDGEYAVVPATVGQQVDVQALLAQATTALAAPSAGNISVSISPTQILPQVSTDQAQAAVDQANDVVSQPLKINVSGQMRTVDADTLKGWVHLDPNGPGKWHLTIEQAPIDQWVGLLKTEVDVRPTNAGYTFEGREPVVTADAPGSALDADASSAAIMAALQARAQGAASGPGTAVELEMATVAPEFTADQAQALVGKVQKLGSWTTRYDSSSHNGFGKNIRRPTNLIDGTVVQPGETFDFLAVAGPITVRNGYTDGAAIIHGNSVLDGVLGGGLCSSSTTLFNAALRAGFEIGARRNHAYYIDRYPVGLDATIWVNGNYAQSMSFVNDSQYPILIRGINRANSVTFSIYGVPDGRQVHLQPAKTWAEKQAWTRYVYTDDTSIVAPGGRKRVEFPFTGFSSSVERVVTAADGSVLHDDTFRSSYRRVIGLVYIGWQPGDPPPGTVEEPGKPADA